MTFIGVFSNRKEYDKLKKGLLLYNLANIEIININNQNIDSLKNIKFDLLVITDNLFNSLDFSQTQTNDIKNVIDNAKNIMINIDIDIGDIFNDKEYSIISYGLNGKATITLSSISEDRIIICLQRELKDIKGNIIENKEVEIKTKEPYGKNLYNTMIVVTILLMYFGRK